MKSMKPKNQAHAHVYLWVKIAADLTTNIQFNSAQSNTFFKQFFDGLRTLHAAGKTITNMQTLNLVTKHMPDMAGYAPHARRVSW